MGGNIHHHHRRAARCVGRLWIRCGLLYLAVVLGTTSVAMISFISCSWSASAIRGSRVPCSACSIRLLYFPSGAIYPVEGFPPGSLDFHIDPSRMLSRAESPTG